MSRFKLEAIEKKRQERKEQKEIAIKRALEYMKRKPDAPKTKVATYAGVHVSVLENWGVELPKPITTKQRRKKTPWGKGQMI